MNWIDSYYEALEFFYFEPQHMRRKKKVNPELQKAVKLAKTSSDFDTVKKRLRVMEVTLNHNINQFFFLAPDSLRNKVFEVVFGPAFEGTFRLHGREQSYFGRENVMQPDFLFTSEEAVVSIEMKVTSQSSIDQVMKYALLGFVLEKQEQEQQHKQHYLMLLGRGSFMQQFKDGFRAEDDLKQAVTESVISNFVFKNRKWLGDGKRFSEIFRAMKIASWNYQSFAKFLQEARPSDLDKSLGAEVCRKLFDGLSEEFTLRKLA